MGIGIQYFPTFLMHVDTENTSRHLEFNLLQVKMEFGGDFIRGGHYLSFETIMLKVPERLFY